MEASIGSEFCEIFYSIGEKKQIEMVKFDSIELSIRNVGDIATGSMRERNFQTIRQFLKSQNSPEESNLNEPAGKKLKSM